jgi:hypothetical protein
MALLECWCVAKITLSTGIWMLPNIEYLSLDGDILWRTKIVGSSLLLR